MAVDFNLALITGPLNREVKNGVLFLFIGPSDYYEPWKTQNCKDSYQTKLEPHGSVGF
jgi:hypothetical protein